MPIHDRRYSFHQGFSMDNALDFSKRSSFKREILLEKFYPSRIILPMKMNYGEAAVPTVRVGEKVTIGQCVGAPNPGSFAVPVHSGISGEVKEIRNITLPNSVTCKAVVIESDRKRTYHPSVYPRADVNISASKARGIVKDAGIVGMGGEGIPTIAKINMARRSGVDRILVNCLQSEPYANCDYMRISESPEYIVMGAVALAGAVGVKRIDFLIPDSRKEEIAALQNAMQMSAGDYSGFIFNFKYFKDRFPQGYYALVAKALYGVDLGEGETLESRCKAVMFNCSTVYSCWEAIADNMPLSSRIISISGDDEPGHNVLVPIGTPVSEILNNVNSNIKTSKKLIWGNCLTGLEIKDPDNTPVIKTTSAISVISRKEFPTSPCIRCFQCEDACPMGLEPALLHNLLKRGLEFRAQDEGIRKCIACGSCSYVCPAAIDLTGVIASYAQKLNKNPEQPDKLGFTEHTKINIGSVSLLETFEEDEEYQAEEGGDDNMVLPFEGGKPI